MYRQLVEPSVTCVEDVDAGQVTPIECTHCAIRSHAICSALSDSEMRALDAVTHSANFSAGSTMVRTGEARTYVYTLTMGALRMVRTLADGRRQITGFVLPGDYVGLTETNKHRHDIEAIVDSRVCKTSLSNMRLLREQFPQIEHKLLQRTSMELATAQDAGLALARLQPSERLANFLLRLAARCIQQGGPTATVTLPMGRGDIADHLGLTMETVSRTFTKLRQQRLIALPQLHQVQILDYPGLRQLACDSSL